MERRAFAALLVAQATASVVGLARAQPSSGALRVGYLSPLTERDDARNLAAFRQGLRELGYVEGTNVAIAAHHANGALERLPELAADLVRQQPRLIVGAPTSAVRALQQATRSIPIVMAFVGDPVADGFVASLARPGGNITGHSTTVTAMAVKRLEFLKTIRSNLARVVVLAAPQSFGAVVTETHQAGRSLGVAVDAVRVASADDVDRAFAALPAAHVQAVIVNLSVRQHYAQIVAQALRARLPTVGSQREFVDAGGMLSYGPHYPDLYRRTATYVDRIAKGAKPGDLPIEQPTRFELVVNLKTADAIGVAVQPSLLARADDVIR